jgi:hypothetical protein
VPSAGKFLCDFFYVVDMVTDIVSFEEVGTLKPGVFLLLRVSIL